MAINKVIVDGTTVLDLTGTTVTAADLPNGKTALDHTGTVVTGTTPKIHSEDGSLSMTNATGTLSYAVREDMVTISGNGIVASSSSVPYVALPARLRPSHAVYGHARSKDSEDYYYTNKAYIELLASGYLYIRGTSQGDTVDFTVSYILEG